MARVHFSGRKAMEKVGKSAAVPRSSSRWGEGKQSRGSSRGEECHRTPGAEPQPGLTGHGVLGNHCRGLTVLEKAQIWEAEPDEINCHSSDYNPRIESWQIVRHEAVVPTQILTGICELEGNK